LLDLHAGVDEHIVVGAVEQLLQTPDPAMARRHRRVDRLEVPERRRHHGVIRDRAHPVLLKGVNPSVNERAEQSAEMDVGIVAERDVEQIRPAVRVALLAADLAADIAAPEHGQPHVLVHVVVAALVVRADACVGVHLLPPGDGSLLRRPRVDRLPVERELVGRVLLGTGSWVRTRISWRILRDND
jgi:hypothetical protein